MNETYTAQAYVLGGRFLLCLYQPDLDMHFPLFARQPTSWRIVNWCVVQTSDAAVVYALVLEGQSLVKLEEPGDIEIETQFGTVSVSIGKPRPFPECDVGVQVAVLPTFLRSLADEGVAAIVDGVSAVRSAFALLDRATFQPARQSSDARSLSLHGLIPASHVVSLEEDPLGVRLISDVRFDWADGDRTEMMLDRPLPTGRALVLSDGGYFPVLVHE